MKLGDFPLVETLVDCRARLVHQRDHGFIRVEIDRCLLEPSMVEQLKPAIRIVLDSRIDEIDQQLHELGVEIA